MIDYVNPFAQQLFPQLKTLGLEHPWLAGLNEAVRELVKGDSHAVRREIMAGECCYTQTLQYIASAQRLRIYSSDLTALKRGEKRLQAQLNRHELLNRITRAIGERQDLPSILQVVVRRLEEDLPIDFGCVALYHAGSEELTVTSVGLKGQPLAQELGMTEQSRIPIDENGLSRCVRGHLVHEPDIREVQFPFPQRLARQGLKSLVVAPLLVESQVFGVLVAARVEPRSFGSADFEFLRQLSEHVALAAHQAQLYGALQQAYQDLRQTQQAVMQQERLRALGQMASGIAHDINNAISPVALYTETLLEKEPNLSARTRDYLETIAHAIDDVAATVARMREFYRQREPELTLAPVELNGLVERVLDLTRARWSDIPQQRIVIDDDPLLVKSLRDILETDGHVVDTANAGHEGIDAFRAAHRAGEPQEVVSTDLGMPYVDGRKVAGAIKGISPATPVILLTGWGRRLVAEGDVPPHVDQVLNKPPKLQHLRQALAQCWQAMSERKP